MQDGCDLRARCVALRVDARCGRAVDQTTVVCPCHCVVCPICNLVSVFILCEVRRAARGEVHVLGVAVQNRGKLLAGDVLIGLEGTCVEAVDHTCVICPGDGVVVILAGRDIGERISLRCSRFAGQSPQDGDNLTTSRVQLAAEAGRGHAIHVALAVDIDHIVIVPVALGNIAERKLGQADVVLIHELDIELCIVRAHLDGVLIADVGIALVGPDSHVALVSLRLEGHLIVLLDRDDVAVFILAGAAVNRAVLAAGDVEGQGRIVVNIAAALLDKVHMERSVLAVHVSVGDIIVGCGGLAAGAELPDSLVAGVRNSLELNLIALRQRPVLVVVGYPFFFVIVVILELAMTFVEVNGELEVLGVDLREGDLHRNVVLVDCSRIDVVINSRCLIVNLPACFVVRTRNSLDLIARTLFQIRNLSRSITIIRSSPPVAPFTVVELLSDLERAMVADLLNGQLKRIDRSSFLDELRGNRCVRIAHLNGRCCVGVTGNRCAGHFPFQELVTIFCFCNQRSGIAILKAFELRKFSAFIRNSTGNLIVDLRYIDGQHMLFFFKLRNNGIFLLDFRSSILIREVFVASLAMPVLDVTRSGLGRLLRRNMLQIVTERRNNLLFLENNSASRALAASRQTGLCASRSFRFDILQLLVVGGIFFNLSRTRPRFPQLIKKLTTFQALLMRPATLMNTCRSLAFYLNKRVSGCRNFHRSKIRNFIAACRITKVLIASITMVIRLVAIVYTCSSFCCDRLQILVVGRIARNCYRSKRNLISHCLIQELLTAVFAQVILNISLSFTGSIFCRIKLFILMRTRVCCRSHDGEHAHQHG